MTPKDFQAYCVKLAMEAFDSSWPVCMPSERDKFAFAVTERMAQAAQVFACEVDEARQNIPTDEEAERAHGHEMRLRTDEACARMYDGEADCSCLDEPDDDAEDRF
jgi:predicted GNAT family acetyltransferase